MNILVVEDEKKLAQFTAKGLEEHGFAVTVLHNGDEAYALACVEPFDLIVLDIMLPGRDELSILKNLRAKKKHGSGYSGYRAIRGDRTRRGTPAGRGRLYREAVLHG